MPMWMVQATKFVVRFFLLFFARAQTSYPEFYNLRSKIRVLTIPQTGNNEIDSSGTLDFLF